MSKLKPCEFRQNRVISVSNPEQEEIVCMAAGGERLALLNGSHAKMERICSAGPVPVVIANDTCACLYLRPVRMPTENKTYFSCSIFFRLFRSQPEDMRECHGCSYWYPRPGLDIIKGYEETTEYIRQYILHPPETLRVSGTEELKSARSTIQRLVEWVMNQLYFP
jgi:hypothetical protein